MVARNCTLVSGEVATTGEAGAVLDETLSRTDGEVTVLVPVDLSATVYDVTVLAELLADKKVLATAYAPVQLLVVRVPLVVKLEGPNRIEAVLDPKKGTTVKIQGNIERLEGMKADVTVVLTGLPAGAKAVSAVFPRCTVGIELTVAGKLNNPDRDKFDNGHGFGAR